MYLLICNELIPNLLRLLIFIMILQDWKRHLLILKTLQLQSLLLLIHQKLLLQRLMIRRCLSFPRTWSLISLSINRLWRWLRRERRWRCCFLILSLLHGYPLFFCFRLGMHKWISWRGRWPRLFNVWTSTATRSWYVGESTRRGLFFWGPLLHQNFFLLCLPCISLLFQRNYFFKFDMLVVSCTLRSIESTNF